jgi:hypothetical protein
MSINPTFVHIFFAVLQSEWLRLPSLKGAKMSDDNNLGDHTQWSNARMTGVGLTIAGGVSAAIGAGLMNMLAARRRPVRYVSAKQVRLTNEEADAAMISLADLLLKHAHGERDAALARAAEAEAELLRHQLARSRS